MRETPASREQKNAALTTARILLEIKAVNFRPADPFILTSGRASPVYIDCRKIISFPRARKTIVDLAVAAIEREAGIESFDAVAGGETAGIPFAAWIADRLDLAMLYVRKEPKGFGRMAQIEGEMAEGCRALLVEDLATDAASKLDFINALREAGGVVRYVFVVFSYGIFPEAPEKLEQAGVKLVALATWWDVIEAAQQGSYFPAEALNEVKAFLENPRQWSAKHGAEK